VLKANRRLVGILLFVLLSGCAGTPEHVDLMFEPAAAESQTGSILLHFTDPVLVDVAIDGELVAEEVETKETLEISAVPAGERQVRVMIGGKRESTDETYTLTILPGEQTMQLIAAPPVSSNTVLMAGLGLIAVAVILAY